MSPLLLTPGPLTTAQSTREALLVDYGSRDPAFIDIIVKARAQITSLLDTSGAFTCIPLQGSGTFAVEGMIGTLVPPDGGLLVCINGAYGRRIAALANHIGRRVVELVHHETQPIEPASVASILDADPDITHVAIVHCETTTGLLNPIDAVADVVEAHGRRMLVDSMSAFGALPIVGRQPIDAVAASSNKCLEGVPGLGFVIARRTAMERCAGNCHSVTLDLYEQEERLQKDDQFRFTPPTHVIAALSEALRLHAEEGGVEGRGRRYANNRDVLCAGLEEIGFELLLAREIQAPIIITVMQPDDPNWSFKAFYDGLIEHGFAIYPGKLTEADTFRVGCIGQVFPEDIRRFLEAVQKVLDSMDVTHLAPEAT